MGRSWAENLTQSEAEIFHKIERPIFFAERVMKDSAMRGGAVSALDFGMKIGNPEDCLE
jgi:hypothetical protein